MHDPSLDNGGAIFAMMAALTRPPLVGAHAGPPPRSSRSPEVDRRRRANKAARKARRAVRVGR